MLVNSPTLIMLSRGLDRSGPAGLEDSNLEIPSAAVMSIRVPQSIVYPDRLTTPQRQTVLIGDSPQVVANGAASTFQRCSLGKGLWRIFLWAHYVANYSVIAAGSGEGLIFLQDDSSPSIPSARLLEFFAFNGAPQFGHFNFMLTVDREPQTIYSQLAANGVGQAHKLAVQIMAEKLL